MKATEEQMEHLTALAVRCEVARIADKHPDAEAVLAGVAATAAVLLPPKQFATFCADNELDGERLSQLARIVPSKPE